MPRSHAVSSIYERLCWFLENKQIHGASAGTLRSELAPPEEAYHSVPLNFAQVSFSEYPAPVFPAAYVRPLASRDERGFEVISGIEVEYCDQASGQDHEHSLDMIERMHDLASAIDKYKNQIFGTGKLQGISESSPQLDLTVDGEELQPYKKFTLRLLTGAIRSIQ